MPTIQRNALIAYSARQMFELVNRIEDYPQFLPWCSASQIIVRTPELVEASLEINWKGVRKSFSTRNILHPDKAMEIQLLSGPFRHLEGRWQFLALNETGSKVSLALEFEFTGNLLDKLFQPVFNYIANTLVDAFCQRAEEVYGPAIIN